MKELTDTLKLQIIEQLNLNHLKVEDIDEDKPLFGEGLGLDSIDALELIVLMQQKYGVKLANPADGPKIFYSVKTIAEYIAEHRSK